MVFARLLRALLAISPLALAGCGNALIYGERTSFNLVISVNDNAALPLSVNAGLQRTVVNFAPSLGGTVASNGMAASAKGESVSAVSSFNLTDVGRDTNPLGGTLRIQTLFASGEAAVTIATRPEAVATIMSVPYMVVPTSTKLKLVNYLGKPVDPAKAADLRKCVTTQPIDGLSLPVILNQPGLEATRAELVSCLKL